MDYKINKNNTELKTDEYFNNKIDQINLQQDYNSKWIARSAIKINLSH